MKYYVYTHVDPRTSETRYIGKGSGGRAWTCSHSTSAKGRYGNRNLLHQNWIQNLIKEGYTPADWVVIIYQGKSNSEALNLEKLLIEDFENKDRLFNSTEGWESEKLKHTKEEVRKMISLRTEGFSYREIGEQMNIKHYPSIQRILTGKLKGYTKWLK